MAQLLLKVGYRPLRIGWCLRQDDMNSLRKALKLTHTLWGGTFNPLVVVDDEKHARNLVSLFKLDALFAINDDNKISEFIEQHKHISWPTGWKELFIDQENLPTVLDISHPVYKLRESHEIKPTHDGHGMPTLFKWDENDGLKDVFLATFGAYPSQAEIGRDYSNLFTSVLEATEMGLSNIAEIPANADQLETPNIICEVALSPDYRQRRGFRSYTPGLFFGSANSFNDLITFWNLRCSELKLMFYDNLFESRLRNLCKGFMERLQQHKLAKGLLSYPSLWLPNPQNQQEINEIISSLGLNSSVQIHDTNSEHLWNGMNIQPNIMTFGEQSIIGVTEETEDHSLILQLPSLPIQLGNHDHTQHFVVTTHFSGSTPRIADFTFHVPYFPELNEFVGRASSGLYWDKCRIQQHGIDYVIRASESMLFMKPLKVTNLITKVVELFNIKSTPSKPGLMASRLIKQRAAYKIAGFSK